MKVFLKAYIKKNLGDDLFIDILANRYKSTDFLISSDASYLKNKNLKYYKKNIFTKVLNKLLNYFSNKKINYDYIIAKNCDASIIIGGSMFIEGKGTLFPKYKSPLFILGSNFGPHKTEKYINQCTNLFKYAKDVSFRDSKSYYFFKDLKNVRYSTDIVLSYQNEYINVRNDKTVVISVIDAEFKEKELGIDFAKEYEKKIIELINMFNKKKYKIVLMSFCKEQGDEIAINKILEQIKDCNIEKYFYDGNINEAVSIIASSSIIVGTRFHANILGILYNKTIIPIAYSDKTINVLKDMKYKGKIFDVREMSKFNVEKLTDEDLKYKLDNIELKKEAEKHFYELDLLLNKSSNN